MAAEPMSVAGPNRVPVVLGEDAGALSRVERHGEGGGIESEAMRFSYLVGGRLLGLDQEPIIGATVYGGSVGEPALEVAHDKCVTDASGRFWMKVQVQTTAAISVWAPPGAGRAGFSVTKEVSWDASSTVEFGDVVVDGAVAVTIRVVGGVAGAALVLDAMAGTSRIRQVKKVEFGGVWHAWVPVGEWRLKLSDDGHGDRLFPNGLIVRREDVGGELEVEVAVLDEGHSRVVPIGVETSVVGELGGTVCLRARTQGGDLVVVGADKMLVPGGSATFFPRLPNYLRPEHLVWIIRANGVSMELGIVRYFEDGDEHFSLSK